MNKLKRVSNVILFYTLFLIGVFISIFSFVGCKNNSEGKQTSKYDSLQKVMVENHPQPEPVNNNIVAHRGAYRIHGAPYNSLEGFQDAINMHLYAIECDIQLTKDDSLVVHHDATFHHLDIGQTTYDSLKLAGALLNGEKLPLFRDYVKKAMEGKSTRIWVDVKARSKKDGGKVSSAKACVKAMEIARYHKAENFIAGFLIRSDSIIEIVKPIAKKDFNLAYQTVKYIPPSVYKSKGYTWASQPLKNFYPNHAERLKKFKETGINLKSHELNKRKIILWFLKHDVELFGTDYPKLALHLLDSLRSE